MYFHVVYGGAEEDMEVQEETVHIDYGEWSPIICKAKDDPSHFKPKGGNINISLFF